MNLTITGATGFVGCRLIHACVSADFTIKPVNLRDDSLELPSGDVLVHLAAIAHSDASDEDQVFAVNRDLAIATAERAHATGYRHFIFLSSALVWGLEYESVDRTTPEKPDSAYGRAKLEAEEGLRRLESSDFRVTILRPPLLYGPGVKGNLAKLLRAVHRWPVCPLGISENRRSLLHVDNLAAAIIHLARSSTSGTFSPVDAPPISTLEILNRIAARMSHHGKVIAMPKVARWALRRMAPGSARRLFGSFVVTDDSLARTGFLPPFTIDDGFEKMVNAYLKRATEYKQQ
ncbi:MAG: NAD-dependent epimerase/dehydratase family protein [Alkalispirochaeta sp.]